MGEYSEGISPFGPQDGKAAVEEAERIIQQAQQNPPNNQGLIQKIVQVAGRVCGWPGNRLGGSIKRLLDGLEEQGGNYQDTDPLPKH